MRLLASIPAHPEFGKNWKAHQALTDPKYHEIQAERHLDKAIELGPAAEQHALWSRNHRNYAASLRARKPRYLAAIPKP